MISDTVPFQPNATWREMRLFRSISTYNGEGSSAEMTPSQVKGWVSRILVASEECDHGYWRLIHDRGLKGRAAEQVLAALMEAE